MTQNKTQINEMSTSLRLQTLVINLGSKLG